MKSTSRMKRAACSFSTFAPDTSATVERGAGSASARNRSPRNAWRSATEAGSSAGAPPEATATSACSTPPAQALGASVIAGVAGGGQDAVVERRVGLAREHDRRGAVELRERERVLPGARVRLGQRDHDALLGERRDRQPGDRGRDAHDRDVDQVVADGVDRLARVELLDRDLDVGIAGRVPAQRLRDGGGEDVGRAGQAQARADAGLGLAGGALGVVGEPQDPPRIVEQDGAGDGQRDRRGALQQRDPELALEVADLLADCRLGDVQALGGATEVQFLGDGDEIAKVT